MARAISEDWLSSLPSQFRPERVVKENQCFFEVDSYAELSLLPSCIIGSVVFVRSENPCMYMKSTTGWVIQTELADEPREVYEDGG